MPYRKQAENHSTTFYVQPEEAPSLLKALLLPIAIPLLISWALSFYFGLILTAGLAIWIYFAQRSRNVTQYRHPVNFSANANGVTFNGTFYKKEDIHRLIIRNHMNEQYVFVSDYQAYHAPVSTARGLQLRQRLTAVSYRVDMESNGTAIALAGGLTEPTAYAILADVSRLMNFKVG